MVNHLTDDSPFAGMVRLAIDYFLKHVSVKPFRVQEDDKEVLVSHVDFISICTISEQNYSKAAWVCVNLILVVYIKVWDNNKRIRTWFDPYVDVIVLSLVITLH